MPPNSKTPKIPPPPNRSPLLRELIVATPIVMLALLMRVGPLGQSLWYDEMHTLGNYIGGPWRNIVSGHYSPNNHILFNLLAKLFSSHTDFLPDITILIRLPSLLAGSLIPIALVWPIRRTCPKLAIAVAIIAAFHPWLIVISAWARGYALLLLLCILATNFLPKRNQLIAWPYSVLAAAALYTQPLAILLIAAHGLVMLIPWHGRLARDLFLTWLRSALLTGAIIFALYLPFLHGAREYWSAPERPSVSYPQFILSSLQFSLWGGQRGGAAAIAVALIILIAGSFAARHNSHIQPMLLTFLFASILGLLFPLAVPLAGETRAMIWLIPLFCICAVVLIGRSTRGGPLRFVGAIALIALVAIEIMADLWIAATPEQPIRDAVAYTSKFSNGADTIGIYMASRESGLIYGLPRYNAYQLNPDNPPTAQSLPSLKEAEAKAGPQPFALVFFENFVQRDRPDLWNYLQQNYTLIQRLPGRLSPTAIYQRRSPPSTRP
jgi:uncharacterized membrane protein